MFGEASPELSVGMTCLQVSLPTLANDISGVLGTRSHSISFVFMIFSRPENVEGAPSRAREV